MSETQDEYQIALREFRAASDRFHHAGAPDTGELTDQYHATAERLREAASHRGTGEDPPTAPPRIHG